MFNVWRVCNSMSRTHGLYSRQFDICCPFMGRGVCPFIYEELYLIGVIHEELRYNLQFLGSKNCITPWVIWDITVADLVWSIGPCFEIQRFFRAAASHRGSEKCDSHSGGNSVFALQNSDGRQGIHHMAATRRFRSKHRTHGTESCSA